MLLSANIFQPLIDVFQSVISFFHDSVGVSWGWSIVLLTVCVRLVLIPLTIKQLQGMRRLQLHQPELKALQQKYKDDKQRQQQEMMKFYRENNVNPFSSCLPMVLQVPVFISLFYMLKDNLRMDICRPVQLKYRAEYAQHYMTTHHVGAAAAKAAAAGQTTACTHYGPFPDASFLFIHDITAQATGVTLIILILLYVGTQMSSTILMAQPTMDPKQRRLMMLLPVVFVVFIIRFPAGLLVYWITTNAWTMAQQYIVRRRVGPAPAAATGGGDGGDLEGGGDEEKTGVGSMISRLRGGEGPREGGDGEGRKPRQARTGTTAGQRPAAPPPRPPRKKKKRSGRRR